MTRELVAFLLFALAALTGGISIFVPFPRAVALVLTLIAAGFAVLHLPA